MEIIVLPADPLPETTTTISLPFFAPQDLHPRGNPTAIGRRKERDGKITFNPLGFQIYALTPTPAIVSLSNEVDFYLITMPFTLHELPGAGYYEEITFLVDFIDNRIIARDLFPKYISTTGDGVSKTTVADDFTFSSETSSHLDGPCFRLTGLQPVITGFGQGDFIFHWIYKGVNTRQGVLPGTKQALAILQVPRGLQSIEAEISAETLLVRRVFDNPSERKTECFPVTWDLNQALPFWPASVALDTVSEIYDVCVVCALREEGHIFMRETEQLCGVQFAAGFNQQLTLPYYSTSMLNQAGEALRLHVSWPPREGVLDMGLHLNPLFRTFRPRFVAMPGICAGDKQSVRLGDLIIADQAYLYDSGKNTLNAERERTFHSDATAYQTSQLVQSLIKTFESERFSAIKADQHTGTTYHIGAIASGNAVRADHPFETSVFPIRKTLAIDMEGTALYRAIRDFPEIHALLAKGVSDFADSDKNDAYHKQASSVSARYMLAFIRKYVNTHYMPRIR